MHVSDLCVYECMCVCVCGSVYMCSNYEASSMIMEISLIAFPIQTKSTTQTSQTYLFYVVNFIMLSFHVPGDSPPGTTD